MKDWIKIINIFLLCTLCFIPFSCTKGKKKLINKESLRINFPEEPVTMDPRKGGDVYSSAMHFFMFEGLTKISPNSSCDLAVAKKIEISEDNLTYTFHLRECLWSNGIELTADDFEYSWKSMLDPSFPCPNANLLYPILNAEEAKKGLVSLSEVGVKAKDPKTLIVTLKSPTPYFLNLTSFCVFFPVCKSIVEKNPKWADNLNSDFVVNGPYILEKWKHQDCLSLNKNFKFWNESEVNLKKIDISLIGNENTVLEMFCNGELDILGSPYTNIPIDAASDLNKKQYLKAFPVGKTLFCSFNVEHPYLKNKHIRRALSLSLDREQIVNAVGILDEIPATNFVAPILKKGFNKELFKSIDLDAAKQELKIGLEELNIEAKQLEELSLIYPNQEYAHRIAQIVQNHWKKNLGIQIKVCSVETKTFLEKLNTGDFTISQYFLVAQYDDPMNILDRFRKKSNPKNYSNWENERYISLLDQSAFELGTKREVLLDEAEEIFIEEMPIAPIFHGSSIRMIQPYIKGIYTSSIGSVHLEKIYFDEEKLEEKLKIY